jgi:hypothetical protein
MGAEAEILDDGCCGMAGSFGFEEQKYDLSMQVYEHRLGPHLRELPTESLVLADGFSCKTQIEQATGRRPLHLAQLLQGAKPGEGPLDYPSGGLGRQGSQVSSALIRTGALVLGGTALGLGAFYLTKRMFR